MDVVSEPDGLDLLDAIEARVLACLMEKQRTTPDSYPLTLNALLLACNQKSSRNPVFNLDLGEVGHCVNRLRDRGLIHASFSGRTERYDHKMASSYRINREEQALLCALMLRGPQTPGELRSNTARMAEFQGMAAVEATLACLEARQPPLVVRLPRSPGKREERFAHLLSGEVAQDLAGPAEPAAHSGSAEAARVSTLESEVAALKREIDALWELTGLSGKRPGNRA